MNIEVIAKADLLIKQNGQDIKIVKGDKFTLFGMVFNYKGAIINICDYPEVFDIQKTPGIPKIQTYQFTSDIVIPNADGDDVLFTKGTKFTACNDVVYVNGCVFEISRLSYAIKHIETTDVIRDANIAFCVNDYSVALGDIIQVAVTKDTPASVTFTSSDETVATVDNQGIITGIKEGSVIITATCDAVEGFEGGSATVSVVIMKSTKTDEPVEPEKPEKPTIS